jgi:uncharacterized protein (DUF362 family)
MKTSKRRFLLALAAAGAAAAGFLLYRSRRIVGHLFFSPSSPDSRTASYSRSTPFRDRHGKHPIGLVRGSDPEAMVERAVELLDGWHPLELPGRTVLVKPNVVAGKGPPTTTSPDVVESVVRALHRHGVSRVLVGDMSALQTLPTKKNMARTGIRDAAERAGAEILCFEDHAWRDVRVSGGPWSGVSETPQLLLASHDRIAADVVGLALIGQYGRSPQVSGQDVWRQKQIARAVELGLGADSPGRIRLRSEDALKDGSSFDELIAGIKRRVGLEARGRSSA